MVPTQFPITPFPNLEDYEPNDFYDLRPGPSKPLNNSRVKNEWFDASPSLKNMLAQYQYPKRLPLFKNMRIYGGFLQIGEKREKYFNKIALNRMPGTFDPTYKKKVEEEFNPLAEQTDVRMDYMNELDNIRERKNLKPGPRVNRPVVTSKLLAEDVILE